MKNILKFSIWAALFILPVLAFAQTRGELEKRRYNEKGQPIVETREEICKGRYEKDYGACISRALQNSDLSSSDRSFYKICSRQLLAGYRNCLGKPEALPPVK
jgi:hypothetical protein